LRRLNANFYAQIVAWVCDLPKRFLPILKNIQRLQSELRLRGAGGEGFGAGFHGGDAAAAFGGAVDYLFDALHPLGEVEFAPEGFYVGLDLGPLEIHFLAGVVDEGFGECAVEDEGAEHVPVAEDLEDVGGLLVPLANAVDEVFGGVGIEWTADVGASLTHDGLAAEFVEVEEEFGLLDRGFGFWHGEKLAGRGGESTVESRRGRKRTRPDESVSAERFVGLERAEKRRGSAALHIVIAG
jgi:hypothetical protein